MSGYLSIFQIVTINLLLIWLVGMAVVYVNMQICKIRNRIHRLENKGASFMGIRIVFKHENVNRPELTFVEIENFKQQSLEIGTFSTEEDGFAVLTITQEDFNKAIQASRS